MRLVTSGNSSGWSSRLFKEVPNRRTQNGEKPLLLLAGITILGAGTLGVSLSTKPGSFRFYLLTNAVAAIWLAGGVVTGGLDKPSKKDRGDSRKAIIEPISIGLISFGFFYLCALTCRRIPFLNRAIIRVLSYAHRGSLPYVIVTTLANGAAEEVFFRGAIYNAEKRHPVASSTIAYALTTSATRNPALVLASIVMGALFGVQRRATGSLQAPLLTHLTWSTLMAVLLPPLFKEPQNSSVKKGQ